MLHVSCQQFEATASKRNDYVKIQYQSAFHETCNGCNALATVLVLLVTDYSVTRTYRQLEEVKHVELASNRLTAQSC